MILKTALLNITQHASEHIGTASISRFASGRLQNDRVELSHSLSRYRRV